MANNSAMDRKWRQIIVLINDFVTKIIVDMME